MKKIVIITIIIIVAIVSLVFIWKKQSTSGESKPTPEVSKTASISPTDKPQIVSTKPDPLEDTVIAATDVIEITFNRPLENVGEFKSRIEPKIEYKVELSGDRKTAKIIPAKPYALGTTFTLSIGPDSKFDGVGNWGEDKSFHFKTIKYNGV